VRKCNPSVPGLTALLIAGSLAATLLFAAGCKKDEPPPASTGYYSVPMTPKGAPAGKAPGAGNRPGRPASDL